MALEIYWNLSTAAPIDARRAEWADTDRPWSPHRDGVSRRLQINRYDYLAQVARAAELTGFDGIFIPDDPDGEEPWIVTGTLVRDTRRLKLVTQVAPGSASAVYHAKMAASLQRFSGGRQAWAIDLDVPAELRARQGDFVPQAEQAERAGELLTLTDGIWGTGPFDYDGRFFVVEKGGLAGLVAQAPKPAAWIAGGGNDGAELAARHGAVHLLPPQPIAGLAERVAELKARSLRVAAQIDLFTREDRRDLDAERDRLAPAENRLEGTYDTVAATLGELAEAGLDVVLFSAADQIREVHIVGEQIVSRLRSNRARAAA
jgi:alkanesulfonate monooxygenase